MLPHEDVHDRFGCTALHRAAQSGQTAVARQLLTAGADVNAISSLHLTPLQLAARGGHRALMRLLLQYGGDINAGWEGLSVLRLAILRYDADLVAFVLAHGAHARVPQGPVPHWSALELATIWGVTHICELLLEHGADDLDAAVARVDLVVFSHANDARRARATANWLRDHGRDWAERYHAAQHRAIWCHLRACVVRVATSGASGPSETSRGGESTPFRALHWVARVGAEDLTREVIGWIPRHGARAEVVADMA